MNTHACTHDPTYALMSMHNQYPDAAVETSGGLALLESMLSCCGYDYTHASLAADPALRQSGRTLLKCSETNHVGVRRHLVTCSAKSERCSAACEIGGLGPFSKLAFSGEGVPSASAPFICLLIDLEHA